MKSKYEGDGGEAVFIHCVAFLEYHTVKGKNWEFLWLHFNEGKCTGDVYEGNLLAKNGFCMLLDIRRQEGTDGGCSRRSCP